MDDVVVEPRLRWSMSMCGLKLLEGLHKRGLGRGRKEAQGVEMTTRRRGTSDKVK